MLSFEVVRPKAGEVPDELHVLLDVSGLRSLMAQLTLLEEGCSDHIHLMSAAWGGSDLDGEPQGPMNVTMHHVKILLRPSAD